MKSCNKCLVSKELTEFGKDKRNFDGVQGICNLCKQIANKALRDKRVQEQKYVVPAEKACSVCSNVKSIDLFFKDKAMPDNHSTVCKECKKAKTYAWRAANKEQYNASSRAYQAAHPEMRYGSEIKRRYGVTLEQYNQMLLDQKGKCAICEDLHNPAMKKGRLFVDHDHKTGEVRGLLCSSCNSALGYAKDDLEILSKAEEYLKKHRELSNERNLSKGRKCNPRTRDF